MELLKNQLSNENIICLSTSDWEKPLGSRQQIMSFFSNNNRVLYIEGQSSLLHLIKNPRRELKRLLRWLSGLLKRGNIYFYTPPPLIPFGNYFLSINRINQEILLRIVKKIAQNLNFKDPILWLYTINSGFFLGKLGEKLSVYHCIDDFTSEKDNQKRQLVMNKLEDELIKKCDIVLACSRSLCEERKERRPDIYLLRNGIDSKFISQSEDKYNTPEELKGIKYPMIGAVGTLDSRIDVGLISFLANKRKDWQFIFIGDSLMHWKEKEILKKLDNVHLLRFIKHELLPDYIKTFDVCLIPYRATEFNKYIFPLKTLEYLAMGKPVVSTRLPELNDFKDVVKLSETQEEFLNNIELALKNGTGQEEVRRKEIALKNSWGEKLTWLEGIVQNKLSEKYNKG